MYLRKLAKRLSRRQLIAAGAITAVTIIGVISTFWLLAVLPTTASIELEDATVANGASSISDDTASGGRAVQFGAAISSPTDPYSVTGPNAFGIANDGTILLENMSVNDRNQRLAMLQDLGVKWYRQGFLWKAIQPKSTAGYNWSKTDLMVDELSARGIKVMGVIAYVPDWAAAGDCTDGFCTPANYAQFAAFAQAAAQRYKDKGVHHWEIWNEPNLPRFWSPRPNAAAYTDLLKQTSSAIKSVDPNAVVITGGLAPADTTVTTISPTDFLSGIYTNGGKNSFDAIGHHPYCFYPGFDCPNTNIAWSAWSQMSQTGTSLRSIMAANGDSGKKIWATEFGAPTGGDPQTEKLSESDQAKMVTDAYSLWRTYDWAGPLFWYCLSDTPNQPDPNNREWWFGLLRGDGSQKPSYSAYKNAALAAR